MKPFIVSLAVGLLAGALYGVLNVRSPAPPYVALMGLLGILLGEQAVHKVRTWMAATDVPAAIVRSADHDGA